MEQVKKTIWILLTALAFGTMEIALKIGGGSMDALQLTFLRFLIGGLFLLPFSVFDLKKRHYKLTFADFRYLCLLGFVNIVISMTLFQLSVMHSNANLAAVLISINPMFTMIFAHFIASERFTVKKLIVLIICMTGLVLVANPFHLAKGNTVEGILMGLGASASFGLYTALSKRYVGRIGGVTVNSASFLIGAMMEMGLLVWMGDPIISNIGADSIGIIAYTGLVVTGFGYYCFMRAIQTGGASTASYAFFIKPVIAMFLAALILGELITWNIVLGITIIIVGCLYNVYKPRKKTQES